MTQSTITLGESCDFIRGVTFDGALVRLRAEPKTIPILRAGNIQEELDTDHDLIWVPEALVSDEQLLRHNDIVICMSSGSRNVVGKTARVAEDLHAACGSFCGVIRPRKQELAPYLSFYFRSPAFARHRDAIARGANIQNLRFSQFADIEVPLPQDHASIADLFELTERLRRARKFSADLAESLAAATFLQWFPADDSLPVFTVEQLSQDRPNAIRTGPFGSQLLHSEFTNSGIAVLGIDNAVNNRFEWARRRYITAEKYEQLKRYTVFPGDVLITIMATCGRCAVVPDDIETAINTKHLCCISPDHERCLPDYLRAAFLFHPVVRKQLLVATKGAIMDGLNMDIIKKLGIPVASRPRQERYVAFLRELDRLMAMQEESFRQADHLLRSLLEEAFV